MVAASFLSTLFLALAVAAGPVERKAFSSKSLHFTKRVKHCRNIVKQDSTRQEHLVASNYRDLKNRAVINSPAENRAVTYVASVGVGSPATNCK